MKTALEWSKEYWGDAWTVSEERAITARDAEHRAELLKLQDDLLAGANREVMAEALIERLRGELGVAKREAEELADEAGCERSANTACGAMLTEARERLDEAKRLLGEIQVAISGSLSRRRPARSPNGRAGWSESQTRKEPSREQR